MELIPKEFKLVKLDMTPKDWSIVQLGENCLKIGSGITPTGGEKVYQEEGRHFIRSQNIGWGSLLLNDIAFINEATHQTFNSTEIKLNDVFLNITGASIGRSAIADMRIIGGNVNQHVCIIRTNPYKIHPSFLNYFLLSRQGQSQVDSFQSGGNRQGLNFQQIKTFKIPLPPTIEEQTLISTALSDVDTFLQSLKKLIIKKHSIKQGTTQELLKPKEGWKLKKLPEVCWFQEGPGVRNSQFTKSGVKLLNGTNIENGDLLLEKTNRYISEKEAFGSYSHFLADAGDIIIACSGISIDKFHEKVTIIGSEHLPLCMNTSTMRFKTISRELETSFLFHFLKSNSFKKQIGGKATGSAQLNFGPSHVGMVEIALPSNIEQERISTILNDMDAETNVLDLKLKKYKMIKQGMMENLLAGKIRLT